MMMRELLSRGGGTGCRVQALSEASLEEVNAMWAGLGYYRRARFLLEGAQYVMQHHGGAFPRTSKELQKIPGGLTVPPGCSIMNPLLQHPTLCSGMAMCLSGPQTPSAIHCGLWTAC